jgi:signal recognition particle subunit SRP54
MSYLPGMGQLQEMMGGVSPEQIKPVFGMIDSMTPDERRNPKLIDNARRQRIAKGAGVQASAIGEMLKQFDMMASMMKGMAGKDQYERMAAVQKMQREAMSNPQGFMRKEKGSTGTRKTNEQRADDRRRREKELKKLKKEQKLKRRQEL